MLRHTLHQKQEPKSRKQGFMGKNWQFGFGGSNMLRQEGIQIDRII